MKLYIYIETNTDYSPFPQKTKAYANERAALAALKDAFIKECVAEGYAEYQVRECIDGKFSFPDQCGEEPNFNDSFASVGYWSACVEETELDERKPKNPKLIDYADGDNPESLYTIVSAWREWVGGEAEMWFCDTTKENDLNLLVGAYGVMTALTASKKGRFLVCGTNYDVPQVANLYSYLDEACEVLEEDIKTLNLSKEYFTDLLAKENDLGSCIAFGKFIEDSGIKIPADLTDATPEEDKPETKEPEAGPDGKSNEIYIVDYFNNELNATQERVFTCLAEAKDYEAELIEGVKESVKKVNENRIDKAVIDTHCLSNGRTTYFYNLQDWDKHNEWGFVSFKIIKF